VVKNPIIHKEDIFPDNTASMTIDMMRDILNKNKIVKMRGIKEDHIRKFLVQFGNGTKEWFMK
jgi:hypothetical protein